MQEDLVYWYWISFLLTSSICAVLQLYSLNANRKAITVSDNYLIENSSKFSQFQSNYLIVYLLAMFSDWLQGPYVYELYEVLNK